MPILARLGGFIWLPGLPLSVEAAFCHWRDREMATAATAMGKRCAVFEDLASRCSNRDGSDLVNVDGSEPFIPPR